MVKAGFKDKDMIIGIVRIAAVLLTVMCMMITVTPPYVSGETLSSPFSGIYMLPIFDLSRFGESYKGKKGLEIIIVSENSPAEDAGIKQDDIILSFDGTPLSQFDKDTLPNAVNKYIRLNKKPGEPIVFKILRQTTLLSGVIHNKTQSGKTFLLRPEDTPRFSRDIPPDETGAITINNKVTEMDIAFFLKEKNGLPNVGISADFNNTNGEYEKIIEKLLADKKVKDNFMKLSRRLEDDDKWNNGFRLGIMTALKKNPMHFPDICSKMTDDIVKAGADLVKTLEVLSFYTDSPAIEASDGNGMNQAHNSIRSILDETLRRSVEKRDEAFKSLTKEEIRFLKQMGGLLIDRLSRHFYLETTSDISDMEKFKTFLRLCRKIDFRALSESAKILAAVSNPSVLGMIRSELMKEPLKNDSASMGNAVVKGSYYSVFKTPYGPVVIGGPENNFYSGPWAVIIDTAGNDVYSDQGGTSATPVSLIIDYSGDDRYTSAHETSTGGGFMGSAFVCDLSGNDFYTGTKLSQGAGFLGAGILLDSEGNDTYRMKTMGQGSGMFGFGILLDIKGNDVYEADLFAQGFGGTKGAGLLYDLGGDDVFYASGGSASPYNHPGVFNSASQGFGLGMRGHASGGIGILLNENGNDLFTAGTFAQGAGYFHGLGILRNLGSGNAVLKADHYAQGAGVHSAAGIIMDDGGNDIYMGTTAALQSAAWDYSLAALIDKSGDDVYDAGVASFSHASAAHDAFSVFLDLMGSERYVSPQGGMSAPQDESFREGVSCSVFFDGDGTTDAYNCDVNHGVLIKGACNVFQDR